MRRGVPRGDAGYKYSDLLRYTRAFSAYLAGRGVVRRRAGGGSGRTGGARSEGAAARSGTTVAQFGHVARVRAAAAQGREEDFGRCEATGAADGTGGRVDRSGGMCSVKDAVGRSGVDGQAGEGGRSVWDRRTGRLCGSYGAVGAEVGTEYGGAGAKGGADRLGTEVRREGTGAERTSEGGAAAASGVMGACFVRGWSVGLVPTKKLPETDRFPGAFRAESEI